MRRRYREVTVFSLSMMDVICSAFGAVVVLMMLMSVRSEQAKAAQEKTQQQLDSIARQIDRFKQQYESAQSAAASAQSERDQAKKELARANLRTQFIGIGSNRRNWLILVDLSGSMNKGQTPEAVSRSLAMLIDVLPEDGSFNIVGYQDAPSGVGFVPWRPAGASSPVDAGRGVLVPVRGNRGEAKRWVAEELVKRFDGGTPTREALLELLPVPGWETIVLFTDGSPNQCQSAADKSACLATMVDEISAFNAKNQNLELHCIGLGEDHYTDTAFALFLEGLAGKNRGGYVGMGSGRKVAAVP